MSPRPKGMETADAREKKLQGHRAEEEFAERIGGEVYKRGARKKDVRDRHGDFYSVKAGEKKWQIFLYAESRFRGDVVFQALNGIGDVFIDCLRAFPSAHSEYAADKPRFKEALKEPMRALREILSRPLKLKAFLKESLFADGIDYLAVKDGEVFHVFHSVEVLNVLGKHLTAENSRRQGRGQVDCQKVVFKRKGETGDKMKTIGEIEIRTDRSNYRLVKFWMHKPMTLDLLRANIPAVADSRPGILTYGKAKGAGI